MDFNNNLDYEDYELLSNDNNSNKWITVMKKYNNTIHLLDNKNKESFVYNIQINNKSYILKLLLNIENSNESSVCKILHSINKSSDILGVCQILDYNYFRINNQRTNYEYIIMPNYIYNLSNIKMRKIELKTKHRLSMDIYQGIKNLHKLGYSHGDIKPANICIDININNDKNRIRLIDFGLSEDIIQSLGGKLPYYTLATYGWFNPFQITNADYFKSEFKNEILDILKSKYYKKYKFINNIHTENVMHNDLYSFCLILIYIYGNEYHFYFKNTKTYDLSEDVFTNIRDFINSPIVYVNNILNNVCNEMPKYWKEFIIKYMIKMFF